MASSLHLCRTGSAIEFGSTREILPLQKTRRQTIKVSAIAFFIIKKIRIDFNCMFI